jgi:hypothetical protein
MRIKNAATLALTAVSALVTVVASPAAAADNQDMHLWTGGSDTNNIATSGFAKASGGVTVKYWCLGTSGNVAGTEVQLVSLDQTVAYRALSATCDGLWHSYESLNAPSNTAMRARLHVYSPGRITGDIDAYFYGHRV